MSQTPGIYKSPDVFSRSKGEVYASDADESADKKGGKVLGSSGCRGQWFD
jgi:hypothetical protein